MNIYNLKKEKKNIIYSDSSLSKNSIRDRNSALNKIFENFNNLDDVSVITKDKILDNFDGKISFNGKVKSYPVFFGQSQNPNWQNYALTYDAYYTAGGETT